VTCLFVVAAAAGRNNYDSALLACLLLFNFSVSRKGRRHKKKYEKLNFMLKIDLLSAVTAAAAACCLASTKNGTDNPGEVL